MNHTCNIKSDRRRHCEECVREMASQMLDERAKKLRQIIKRPVKMDVDIEKN